MVNDSSSNWVEYEVNGRMKHYCPECYKFDNEDRLMLNGNRKKEPNIYSRDECVFNYCASPDLCKEKDTCCNG